MNLNRLLRLSLSHNRIIKIDVDAFENKIELKYLNLSNNMASLDYLYAAHLRSVIDLDLSFNGIEYLNSYQFSKIAITLRF